MKPLRQLLVAGLLAGWLAPLSLPASKLACCCPDGMYAACSRMETGCSLRRCAPDHASALSLTAPKILLRSAPALPAPLASGFLAFSSAARVVEALADPTDPPPRA